jgi:hypothetical protein
MEAKNRSRHMATLTHQRKVARRGEKWGLHPSSRSHVTTTPSAGVLDINTELNDDLGCSIPQGDLMDLDPPSSTPPLKDPLFLPDGTDVGFLISSPPASDHPPLNWEDYLYQSLQVDPILDGYVSVDDEPQFSSSKSNLLW